MASVSVRERNRERDRVCVREKDYRPGPVPSLLYYDGKFSRSYIININTRTISLGSIYRVSQKYIRLVIYLFLDCLNGDISSKNVKMGQICIENHAVVLIT